MIEDRPRLAPDAVHRIVLRDENAFTSHPFLGGLWQVANGDIVAAFMQAGCSYASGEGISHDIITMGKRRMVSIRSTDGGKTWNPASLTPIFETPEPADFALPVDPDDRPLNPEPDADILMVSGAAPALLIADARPWMRISVNGGRSWRKPLRLPMFNLASVSGHGSVARRADGLWLCAMTAASADAWRRRPVLYGSWDGEDWNFLSFITPPQWDDEVDAPVSGTPRFWSHRHMYPRPLVLRDGRILMALRCQRSPTGAFWTELFESRDGGRTFAFLNRVNDWGAPGHLVELSDGRILCVYGYRLAPQGIRYRLSPDGGASWGSEMILRDDGGSWDLGYPRAIEIAPGRVLAVYYMNCARDPIQANGGVRHIAATEFSV